MALVTVPTFWLPAWPSSTSGAPSLNSGLFVMDAASELAVAVFKPPKAGNISKIECMVGAVTIAPTENHDFRLETVDLATGLNSGTLWATNTNGTQLLNTTGWKSQTLTASAVIGAGDLDTYIAAVVKAPATNFGNIAISYFTEENGIYPYGIRVLSTLDDQIPIIIVGYDDGSYAYVPGLWPMASIVTTSFNSGTNPNRRGLRFKLPVPTRLSHAWLISLAQADLTLVFYASDGTTATTIWTSDAESRGSAGGGLMMLKLNSSSQVLAADTFYRVVILPSSLSNVTAYHWTSNSAALLDAGPAGQNFHLTTANGAPAAEADWTQTLTSVPLMGLGFDQIDDGAGSGGGSILAGAGIGLVAGL